MAASMANTADNINNNFVTENNTHPNNLQELPKEWSPGCENLSVKLRQKWLARAEMKFTKTWSPLFWQPLCKILLIWTGQGQAEQIWKSRKTLLMTMYRAWLKGGAQVW